MRADCTIRRVRTRSRGERRNPVMTCEATGMKSGGGLNEDTGDVEVKIDSNIDCIVGCSPMDIASVTAEVRRPVNGESLSFSDSWKKGI